MLNLCKEQVGRILRHGLGCAHYTPEDLRDLAQGSASLLGEEATRRDLIANPPKPRDRNEPVIGLLSDLEKYIVKQQAAQTGDSVA
jgi:hypothetical protein